MSKLNNHYDKTKKLIEKVEKEILCGQFTTDELSDLMDMIRWVESVASEKESKD